MGIGEYNWDAWSHEDLHAMINGRGGGLVGILEGTTGRGVAGGAEAAEAWGRFSTLMDDLQRRTADALARAGVAWEGRAAESAQAGITPLGQWAGDAGTAGAATRGGTSSLVDFYSAARNGMPEPVAAGSTANSDFLGIPAGFTHLLGGQTDQDQQERAAQEAKLEAVRVLDSYREHSATSVADLGRFVPPPTVVAEIGVVAPEVAPVGETPGFVPNTIVENVTPPPPSRPPAVDGEPTVAASSQPTTAPPAVAAPKAGGQDIVPDGTTTGSTVAVGPVTRPGGESGHRKGTGTAVGSGPESGSGSVSGAGTVSRLGSGEKTGGRPGTGSRLRARSGAGVADRVGSAPPAERPVAVPREGGSTGVLGRRLAAGQQNSVPSPASAKPQPGAGVAQAGRPAEEEDLERFTPDYLNGSHDEFWGVEPSGRVAPPVIGG